MTHETNSLSAAFREFFHSERAGGIVLAICTILALLMANSPLGESYRHFWHLYAGGLSIEHWINDGLMAVFFLLIGLELERELYVGELSDFRNAILPIAAAIGGMIIPAGIHFYLNAGSATQGGFGIPMATDIAFALGVLVLLGGRIPAALKVFVVAFAVMDDLGAIIVIAIFYTSKISVAYLLAAAVTWLLLVGLNRLRVMSLIPYLIGGVFLWYFFLQSGVHATLAGVLLAFAIPFDGKKNLESPSHRLEHLLHKPVVFGIIPLFALANTALPVTGDSFRELSNANGLGIVLGLVVGKPIGVLLGCLAVTAIGVSRLPQDVSWRHIAGAGMLGGIGFTMSIFIANLAFATESQTIASSKLAILCASVLAGVIGYMLLRFGRPSITSIK